MQARFLVLLCAAGLAAQAPLQPSPQTASGFVNHAAHENFVPGRVVVRFDFPVAAAELDRACEAAGLDLLQVGYGAAFHVLEVPAGTELVWASWLAAQEIVEYAEPDYVASTCADPNDPLFKPYQWNFFRPGEISGSAVSNFGVNGQDAWALGTGSGVTVAIIDTGIAYESSGSFVQAPDLAGATFVAPYDFVGNDTHANDDNQHGTHVAGTVRQSTNNGIGVAGLAHGCNLMPVKVLNAGGSGSYTAIANGIRYAADNGAKVLNLSLGGSSGSSALSSAVSYAWGKGCVICAAAGNTGRNKLQYPARYSNCIAVGATRFDGTRSYYSTYGSGLDVTAPGGDVTVDQNGDGYGDGILQQTFAGGSPTAFGYYFFQGTSMATPHVAAIAAMLFAKNPGWSNAQVRARIESTCTDRGKAGYDTTYGYGIVNAYNALR